ncbi:MAG: hypothetical protein KGL90_07825 [Burkholderiales bacterium]|nr:hypothetical protein [Burkholderiales bacterium]
MLNRFITVSALTLAAMSTAQAAPSADYSVQFDSSFNAAANPNLSITDADVQADGLHTYYGSWGASTISVSNVLSTGSEYTLNLNIASVSRTDWTRKLVDFAGQSSNAGVYIDSGRLSFYDQLGHLAAQSSTELLAPGQPFQFTLTRTSTGDVTGYFNGSAQFSFQDTTDLAVFNTASHRAYVLTDDFNNGYVPYEITPGVVRSISVYNQALSATNVASITAVPETESAVLALAGLLLVIFLIKRRGDGFAQ